MKLFDIFGRSRLFKPVPPFSIPADLARQYRGVARAGLMFGILGLSFGGWEHYQRGRDAQRPPPVVVALLDPQGRPIRSFAADHLTEDAFETVAKATAAQFVVRLRNITTPIDFTLAAINDGRYFLKDVAAAKVNAYLGTRPFDELAKRGAKRAVLLDEVIPTRQPGVAKDGTALLISVQWPERIELNGATVKTERRGGTVLVERVPDVPPAFAKVNPIGLFISDFDLNTPD